MVIPACVLITMVLGAALQRVSGMGLSLVGGPILMLLLGPVEGILVVNILACVNAALLTVGALPLVDWKKLCAIAAALVVGAVPGAFLVARTDTVILLIVVGAALLLALGGTVFGKKHLPVLAGYGPMVCAGAIAGFTNSLAGVAGPVIVIYAQASKWDYRSYTATLQPILMLSGLISVLAKVAFGVGGFENTTWTLWPAAMVGMLLGIWIGARLSGRVSKDKARALSLSVASAGALLALIRGTLGLIAA